eukprot:c9817_g1_i3.p1 GENE.c9817_g1_i3~~c9817_g1_i3.p1  ORF type:complete len:298 (-),score=38.63 c9817_g1_i3:406-1299(-)
MDTAYTNPYFNIVEQMLNDLFQKIIFHRPEDIHSFAYDYFTQQPQIMLEMQHVFHQTPPLGYEDQLAPSSADLLVSSLSFPATTEIVCTICGKCFSRTSNLNRHMQTHLAVNCTGGASGNPQLVADDRRPHRCTYDGCTKTFMLLSALNSHIRLHTGEGTYTCEHSGCGKAFLLPSHLASHLVTHSTDRPQHNCTFPVENGHTFVNSMAVVWPSPKPVNLRNIDVPILVNAHTFAISRIVLNHLHKLGIFTTSPITHWGTPTIRPVRPPSRRRITFLDTNCAIPVKSPSRAELKSMV